MTDQPKQMSVQTVEEAQCLLSCLFNTHDGMFDNLIAAVERRERWRVLAEFRMLADGYWTSQQNMSAASDICDLIKSLENPNQKP